MYVFELMYICHFGKYMASRIVYRSISSIVTASRPVNPYTCEPLPLKKYLQPSQIFDKIGDAKNAYDKWRKLSLQQRVERVTDFTNSIINDQCWLNLVLADFTGKSVRNISREYHKLSYLAPQIIKGADKSLSPHQFETLSLGNKLKNKIIMEPVGLTLLMPYFAQPIFDSLIHLIPCLISGNAALLKVSDFNHFLGGYLEEKANSNLGVSGLVTDLFIHPKDIGHVRQFRSIKKLIYSGSQQSASKIFQLLTEKRFIDCNLFYGGRDCAFVDRTAQLNLAVRQICLNSFYNNGQSYDCIKRLYVHQQISNQLFSKLVEFTSKIKLGDPKDPNTDLGPLTVPESAIKFEELLNDAINTGASCMLGGLITNDGRSKGIFCEPTILTECESHMQIVQTQLHAPVLCCEVVNDIDQFVKRASENEYGTGIRIFAQDPLKFKSYIDKLQVGYISFNSGSITQCNLPIQGWKKSGKGKMLSDLSYNEYVIPKTFIYQQGKND